MFLDSLWDGVIPWFQLTSSDIPMPGLCQWPSRSLQCCCPCWEPPWSLPRFYTPLKMTPPWTWRLLILGSKEGAFCNRFWRGWWFTNECAKVPILLLRCWTFFCDFLGWVFWTGWIKWKFGQTIPWSCIVVAHFEASCLEVLYSRLSQLCPISAAAPKYQ